MRLGWTRFIVKLNLHALYFHTLLLPFATHLMTAKLSYFSFNAMYQLVSYYPLLLPFPASHT